MDGIDLRHNFSSVPKKNLKNPSLDKRKIEMMNEKKDYLK